MAKAKTVTKTPATTAAKTAKSVWSKLKFVEDQWDALKKYGQIKNKSGLTSANKKLIDANPHGVIKFTDGKTIIKVIRLSEGVYDVWGTDGIPDGIVGEIETALFNSK
jgi:hypothetical protein